MESQSGGCNSRYSLVHVKRSNAAAIAGKPPTRQEKNGHQFETDTEGTRK